MGQSLRLHQLAINCLRVEHLQTPAAIPTPITGTPVGLGLLAWTAYQIALPVFGLDKQGLGASLAHGWEKWLIALGTFLILTFTGISPILLVLIAAGIGLIFFR